MRRFNRTALALALLASSAGLACAQDNGDHGDREGRRGEARGEPQPGIREDRSAPRQAPEAPTMGGWQRDANGNTWRGVPQGRVEAPPAPPSAPSPPPAIAPRQGRDGDRVEGRGRPDGFDDRRGGVVRDEPRLWSGRDHDRDRARGWRGDDDHRDWRRDDRNVRRGWDWDDRRDWSWRDRDHDDWRWRSQNRYRGWNYRPPVGYYSRSWIFGDLLPRSWWTPDYQITQWWAYGLPRPPLGSAWIRVGDDALLIDRFTGRVFRVVYDVFW